MSADVLVLATGTANVASVMAGIARAGGVPRVVEDTGEIATAGHVVLPGVGAFGPAMEEISRRGAVDPLRERIAAGRSTLAVCLGLQLLCEGSAESPGVNGLGVLPVVAERLPADVRVPQIGWNRVAGRCCSLLRDGYAYYANSYCVPATLEGWRVATTTHGREFVAAIEREGVLACQFHPELSGPWGVALLRRWLRAGGASC